jgi:hypothetical protein
MLFSLNLAFLTTFLFTLNNLRLANLLIWMRRSILHKVKILLLSLNNLGLLLRLPFNYHLCLFPNLLWRSRLNNLLVFLVFLNILILILQALDILVIFHFIFLLVLVLIGLVLPHSTLELVVENHLLFNSTSLKKLTLLVFSFSIVYNRIRITRTSTDLNLLPLQREI